MAKARGSQRRGLGQRVWASDGHLLDNQLSGQPVLLE